MAEDLQNRLIGFASDFLKRDGDLRDRSIQRWHLASDIFASGVFASGYFESIKIDGPTSSGYVLTTDADGWGTWQPAECISSLSQLTDVAIASPTNYDTIVYNSSTSKWENRPPRAVYA